MILAAIDPGMEGALAKAGSLTPHSTSNYPVCDLPIIVCDLPTIVCDLPTMGAGTNRMIDGSGLARALTAGGVPHLVIIEHVQSMPKQGVASTFRFGTAFGQVLGVVQALQLPYELVRPQTWKKQMGLAGGDKEASRKRAIERFPGLADQLARKRDHNRAEALMLLLYWGQHKLLVQGHRPRRRKEEQAQ